MGIQFAYPYLNPDVCAYFNALPPELKHQKQILRDCLKSLGCSEEVCSREKRAAQFGSGAAKMAGACGYDVCDAGDGRNIS